MGEAQIYKTISLQSIPDIFCLAGLPRSGTTLLASILGQNPKLHSSATSALLPSLVTLADYYHNSPATVASSVKGQCREALLGMVAGFYRHVERPIILDKNRSWPAPQNILLFEELFGRKPKIICPVRPIAEVLASYIVLMRKNDGRSAMEKEMPQLGYPLTDEGRCRYFMGQHGNVRAAWECLKAGQDKFPECLLFIEYDDIVNRPQATLQRIYEFLELEPFVHDFNAIENPTPENDEGAYQLPGLHTIRPKLERRSSDPRKVFNGKLYDFYQGGAFWRGPEPEKLPGVLDLQRAAFIRGDYEEAEAYCALAAPDDDRAQFNKAWYLLRDGKLQEGQRHLWRGRAVGLEGKQVFGSPSPSSQPLWDGRTLNGETVLLALEGGFGDQLCNARFAADIAQRGARVVVCGSPELAQVVLKIKGVSAYAQTQAAGGVYHDYWYPASSILLALGYEYPQLSGKPFIPCPPHKRGSELRVGLRWGGYKDFELENFRRLDPHALFALSDIPGVRLVSLQRDDAQEAVIPSYVEQPPLDTWLQTYHAIMNLDLVISSCTSVAHLAAAMGKPTWIAVTRNNEYFLWSLPGDGSPWYDAVRLFRQDKVGDYSGPYARIRETLTSLARADVPLDKPASYLAPSAKPVRKYSNAVFDLCATSLEGAKEIILTSGPTMRYDERWAKETTWIVDKLCECIRLDRSSRVLDYGCGIGRLSKPLIERFGCHVHGVDTSANMRSLARHYVGRSDRFAVLDDLPDERYDLIIAVWILQHVLEPEPAIQELKGRLTEGGRLFVINGFERGVPSTADGRYFWADDGFDVQGSLRKHFTPMVEEPFLMYDSDDQYFWGVYEAQSGMRT